MATLYRNSWQTSVSSTSSSNYLPSVTPTSFDTIVYSRNFGMNNLTYGFAPNVTIYPIGGIVPLSGTLYGGASSGSINLPSGQNITVQSSVGIANALCNGAAALDFAPVLNDAGGQVAAPTTNLSLLNSSGSLVANRGSITKTGSGLMVLPTGISVVSGTNTLTVSQGVLSSLDSIHTVQNFNLGIPTVAATSFASAPTYFRSTTGSIPTATVNNVANFLDCKCFNSCRQLLFQFIWQ